MRRPLRSALVALLLVPAAAAPAAVHAQEPDSVAADTVPGPDPLLSVIGRSDGATVELRWAPGEPGAWLRGNHLGYRVERRRADGAGEGGAPGAGEVVVLTPEPLRPWPLDTWLERADRDNRYAAIAAQVLHGEDVEVEARGELGVIRRRADALRNRHSFALVAADMDTLAAEGLALRLVDRDVVPGARYTYRVYIPPAPPGDTIAAALTPVPDTAYVDVVVERVPTPRGPRGLVALTGEDRIGLRWDRPPGQDFSGYHIDRSADGGATWTRLTDAPFVVMETGTADRPLYIDDGLETGRAFRYRVYGLTPFGELSLPSEVDAATRDMTAPLPPVIEAVESVSGPTVRVRWRLDDPPPDLAGFRLGISTSADGPFVADSGPALPPSARATTDSRAISGVPNYYAVLVLDTAGNAAHSTPMHHHVVDSVPPAPPAGVEAIADTTGVVFLRWERGGEPDLLGWRVFRANQADHVPTLETGAPLLLPVHTDTVPVRTLTRDLYYDVVALDRSRNPSTATRVRVTLPDLVAPGAPVFRAVTPGDTGVALAWIPSPSTDVQRQLLLRRARGDAAWDTLAALGPADTAAADPGARPGVTWEYALVAIDSAGLASDTAGPAPARPYGAALRPAVTGLQAQVRDGAVLLTWDGPAGDAEHWFVVYRADGDGPLRRIASVDEPAFDDPAAGPGGHRYAVQALYRDGPPSPRTAPVAVQVPGGGP